MNILGIVISIATLNVASICCDIYVHPPKMKKRIMLFDMDGTLTPPVQRITEDAKDMVMRCIEEGFDVGIVTSSTYNHVLRQLGSDFVDFFRYIFSVNGTIVHQAGKLIQSRSILDVIPNEVLKDMVEFCLIYIAKLDIPIKRGTFIEHRGSTINISPIGRNCSQTERDGFVILDRERGIRNEFLKALKERYGNIATPLSFSAGGQISIDAFPEDWNKTLALEHLKNYDEIYFFGDRTEEGGIDYSLYIHPDVIGYHVDDYKDLIKKVDWILRNKY